MDLMHAVKKRASIRQFAPTAVSDDVLEQIVDAGRRAPSGYNRQPWEFVIVRDKAILNQLGQIQNCIGQVDAAIAVVVDEKATKYWKEDASAAIENMLLASVALGYSSLWIEGYVLLKESFGKKILKVPDALRLLAILPIGIPAGESAQAGKKSLKDITYLDRYGERWK